MPIRVFPCGQNCRQYFICEQVKYSESELGDHHAVLETLLPCCVGTKNRLPLIESAWEEDLHGYIWGKATALECIPHSINGVSEHIHVVISIPPKLSVATTIGQLKGSSSHHVKARYMDGAFVWQAEYGVLSFSERSLSRVVNYVKNQKKHHAENTLNLTMENLGAIE